MVDILNWMFNFSNGKRQLIFRRDWKDISNKILLEKSEYTFEWNEINFRLFIIWIIIVILPVYFIRCDFKRDAAVKLNLGKKLNSKGNTTFPSDLSEKKVLTN